MFERDKTVVFTLSVILALSGLAMAQRSYPALEARQHGYEHGYRDGFHRGREDRSRNVGYDYKTEDYRAADRGYDIYMGDRRDFQDGYREGYKAGYDDGYSGRSGRWNDIYGINPNAPAGAYNEPRDEVYENRRWGYVDMAYDIGYRDGLEQAEKDRGHNKDFRPEKNDRYEDATHGYRKSYGDKNAYKQQYRKGFVRGYQDGYGRGR